VAVRLATAPSRGVVIAESAVLPSAGGDVVYVEPKHGTFELRLVRIAARFGGRVRLTTGVKVGESVVVRGASALRGEALRSSLGGEDTD
jgi:multidrug efflux pump subunit AcrA (membrane-fusion protein)